MSPMSEIEADLKVIHQFQPRARRIFLTGANPFVLTVNRLTDIALLIRKYVGEGRPTIGCFARITDITKKSVDDLCQLHHLGFDFLTIGVESGDSDTLARVNKGYTSEDILEQCSKLDEAGIRYNFFYLVGLAGKGCGESNALRSAKVFNTLHPVSIGFLSLTLFPESQLYQEIFRKALRGWHTAYHETQNNMKGALMSLSDKLLLRKRAIIETVNDELKNIAQVEHSRHRSFDNFIVNLLRAIAAYCYFPKKPTIRVQTVDSLNDRQLTLF